MKKLGIYVEKGGISKCVSKVILDGSNSQSIDITLDDEENRVNRFVIVGLGCGHGVFVLEEGVDLTIKVEG